MGKKLMLGVLAFAAVVFALVFLPKLFPLQKTSLLNESQITDRYPTIMGNATFEEDCMVCDKSGCRQTGKPCWKFNYTRNESGGVVMKDSSVDAETGEETVQQESQCTEWWCDASPCEYQKALVLDDIVHDFNNYGCDNPSPTCDQERMKCRSCVYREDCIREETFSNVTTTYRFKIIGTGGFTEINDNEMVCRIFNYTDMIVMNMSTVAECRVAAESVTRCGIGECSFELSFGMIPY